MTEKLPLLYTKDGPVACIVMNRPDKINAMNGEMYNLLEEALLDYEYDADLRCVVLSGAGGNFTSGGDLAWWKEVRAEAERAGRRVHYEFGAFKAMTRIRKPVIAAVDGWCVASGFNLLLYSDIRIASRRAKFQRSTVKLGPVGGNNDSGYPHPLLANMSLGNALYLSITGKDVTADEALRMGFISEVVDHPDELMPRAVELATAISRFHPEAVAHHRELVRLSAEVPGSFLGQLQLLTRRSLSAVDVEESTDAFLGRANDDSVPRPRERR